VIHAPVNTRLYISRSQLSFLCEYTCRSHRAARIRGERSVAELAGVQWSARNRSHASPSRDIILGVLMKLDVLRKQDEATKAICANR